ncbi:alpha/beta hydrolase [Amycolatopsis sp. TNS106]|uniref:alpha/beta hydrolase n=1 Tax=Amycolatopsis sp. TNS106 TaxID=2861750 RepID=UPI001C56217C|nr:alpha/beta hydrolase [Amycolatopsis sp. TNS106]QXV63537.1 hypothetical protein CVV72_40975 [Amycolatopsis sp. TNS106]
MTLTWGNLEAWMSGPLTNAVGGMNIAYNKLIAVGDDLRDMNAPRGWTGEAADAANARVNTIIDQMQEHAAEVAAVNRILGDTGNAIIGIQHAIAEAQHLAAKHFFTITPAGEIIDAGLPVNHVRDAADMTAVMHERRVAQTELRCRVDETVRVATAIDDGLCSVLDRVLSGKVVDPGTYANDDNIVLASAATASSTSSGLPLLPPPHIASNNPNWATINAAYWDTLTYSERLNLISQRPDLVGRRDGFPAWARDDANRLNLTRHRHDLLLEQATLTQALQNNPLYGPDGQLRPDVARSHEGKVLINQQGRLAEVGRELATVDDIQRRLDRNPATPGEYYLLEFDLDNKQGHVVLARGNPDTAANVATYVPGTTTNIETVGADFGRSDEMFDAANRAGSPSTSVITWLGYDAPQSLVHDAPSMKFAVDASGTLQQFQHGLELSHNPNTNLHTTVLGHSYGSTVVGHTAALTPEAPLADEVVFVASPGAGAEHASAFGIPVTDVHATVSDGDPITVLGPLNDFALSGLGEVPTESHFGAQTFEAGWYNPISAHGSYWDPGNPALDHMGRIISGR